MGWGREYKNFGRATHCALGFLFLFCALFATQNIQSQMLEDDGYGKLGFYSNAAAFLAIAFGSIISTGVMSKIGDVNTMILGSFLCVPQMASFILASLKSEHPELQGWLYSPAIVCTVILSASLARGFGEVIMSVAQGKYIADCATESNKGFFFGYFWAIFMCSEIFGNMIAAIILGELNQTDFIITMTVCALGATVIFVFIQKPTPQNVVLPNDQYSYQKLSTVIKEH